MEQNELPKIEDRMKKGIMDAIKSGRVTMRPRWHFVLRGVLFGVGVLLSLFVLLYLAGFILSVLRETGVLYVPMFGLRGWFSFFRSLPWILIVLSVIFVAILEILVRRYSFGHRKPLFYSILAILLIVLVGGIVTEPWHRPLFGSARQNHLPFAGSFYRNFGMQEFDDIHRGTILSTMPPNSFTLDDLNDQNFTVFFDPQNPQINFGFQQGEMVVVFGDAANGQIQAFGIRQISE